MEYSQEQNSKITLVIEKLSKGDVDIKNSPATKVMAINLLNAFGWDIEKVFRSLGS